MNHTTRNVIFGLIGATILVMLVIMVFYDDIAKIGTTIELPNITKTNRSSISNTESSVILGDIEADVKAIEQEFDLNSDLETDILDVPDFNESLNTEL